MQKEEIFEVKADETTDSQTSLPVTILRSELAQEIVSRRSGFVENWALPIFIIILVVIFGGSWFIHYPDSVSTRAIVFAENLPARIITPKETTIAKVVVNNGQLVKRNDIIAWLESSSDHQQVIRLLSQVNEALNLVEQDQLSSTNKVFDLNYHNLGELQQTYQHFLTFRSLSKPIYRKQLMTLKLSIFEWLNHYTLQAPVSGKVSFLYLMHKGRHLSTGALVGYIIPENSNYYAEAVIRQSILGKIDTGMTVQLKLDAYPYQEWGTLEGKISYISEVINQGNFSVGIKFAPSLITNDRKKIILHNGLTAEAVIITKDIRFFQKFYQGFTSSTSLDK